jgi:hypothetical protein
VRVRRRWYALPRMQSRAIRTTRHDCPSGFTNDGDATRHHGRRKLSCMCTKHLTFEIPFTNVRAFLEHWASRYDDTNDKVFYDPNIGKTDEQALIELFKWKNGGGNIARHKLKTIHTNYLAKWVADSDLEARYLDPAQGNGPIWNIFYLHCRFPEVYPIYDQHAYRAMIYMQQRVLCEQKEDLNKQPPAVVYQSYKRYRGFIEHIRRATDPPLRPIDRALYTFGQFLKRVRPYV